MNARRSSALAAALLLACAPLARAQFAQGSGNQPDTPIDAPTRRAVVESLIVEAQRHYVFPDKARELGKALRQRVAAREYDGITSNATLADSLTAHMQAVTHDLHMRVHYRADPFPQQTDEGEPPAAEIAKRLTEERRRNFGFEQLRRLPGNVGYLDLRSFSGAPDAQAVAVSAMNFLGNVDALIIDLRRNGGGSPRMIQTLLTYLIAADADLHINDFYQRDQDALEQVHALPYVPGQRLAGKPVFVLVSKLTGSAAEEFAYDIQTHKLGTLYGETTAGAANPGGMFRLSDHLAAFIATGRAINPITKTNWEGVGVKPDIAVKAGEALRDAHVAALQQLRTAADDDRKAALDRALEMARATVADPDSDFVRPSRRAK